MNSEVKTKIFELADQHGIDANRSEISDWCDKISELSNATCKLDDVEQTLLNLRKAGAIPSEEGLRLHIAYLEEIGV